jgi:hypothetical protein
MPTTVKTIIAIPTVTEASSDADRVRPESSSTVGA